jgi:hypothetical protein
MSPDEDLVRVIARMLADRGWFIEVRASRINEHFTVDERPEAGWALNPLLKAAATMGGKQP